MSELLHRVLEAARVAEDQDRRERLVYAGAFFATAYVLSLRGPEGILMDLEGLLEHNSRPGQKHVVFALLGTVKGEHHARQHLLPSTFKTDSGIDMRMWLHLVLGLHKRKNRTTGPAFVDERGNQLQGADLNAEFVDFLSEIWEDSPELFPPNVNSLEAVREKYNVFRSLRKGSNSTVIAKQVSPTDRFVVNRWQKKEKAGTNNPSLPLDQYYADIQLLTASFLRYTQAM